MDILNYNDFSYFYILLSLLLLIIVFQSVLSFYLIKKLINLEKLTKNKSELSSDNLRKIFLEARNFLNNSRETSLNLVKRANKESLELINNSIENQENLSDELISKTKEIKNTYSNILKKESENVVGQFRKAITEELKTGVSELKSISSQGSQEVLKEIDTFIDDIHQHVLDSHSLLNNKLQEDLKKVDEFVSIYKSNKIRDIDKNLDIVLKEMTKQYLKKTLTTEQHEEIIKNILKDNKNIIDSI